MYEEYRLKVDILPFSENLYIKDFLDWHFKINRFFELMEVQEDNIVKMTHLSIRSRSSCIVGQYICNNRTDSKENFLLDHSDAWRLYWCNGFYCLITNNAFSSSTWITNKIHLSFMSRRQNFDVSQMKSISQDQAVARCTWYIGS